MPLALVLLSPNGAYSVLLFEFREPAPRSPRVLIVTNNGTLRDRCRESGSAPVEVTSRGEAVGAEVADQVYGCPGGRRLQRASLTSHTDRGWVVASAQVPRSRYGSPGKLGECRLACFAIYEETPANERARLLEDGRRLYPIRVM